MIQLRTEKSQEKQKRIFRQVCEAVDRRILSFIHNSE